MNYTFDISWDSDSKNFLDQINEVIKIKGGSIEGDKKKGKVEIGKWPFKAKGTYEIGSEKVIITITHAPIGITREEIERQIRDNL